MSDTEGFTITHLDSMQVTDGLTPFGVPLGGISGIDYDDATGRYWAISDDRAEKGPARFYTLELTLGPDGRFATDAPVVTGMTPIADQGGEPYPKKGVDPESIRLVHDSTDIVYTSEGDASKLIAPLVRRATAQGEFVRDYALPSQYLPAADASGIQVTGVRNNLALEGLTFSPDGSKIVAVTENSLVQDGQIPSPTNGTDSRVIMFDSAGGDVVDEYIYAVEPISGTYPDMVSPTGFTLKADRGVTEILAVDNNEYLVIERGAVPGKGSEVQIYWASTEGATTVIDKEKLDGTETPMRKKLLFDFSDTGANPDNVEGITWGPTLSDGTRTLVLSADDNFNPEGGQHNMFHVLAVK
ncbi:esterase-like activity of phytase family protein [Rhodococcus sp. ARC_M6]|uniref:esterase-like activity of phytase family protein n=1 Tax=Rhodococcus sp. ARC_M6 TaxID=2928852 RepID=UPI001FB4F612|nr:esterase-like activity of phytase family protein [Rhodococcus sp. ARC_M6]MCJ0906751.1 esterase-like activity of phytase family protein [Rhodococcus sp. ARC_M6]